MAYKVIIGKKQLGINTLWFANKQDAERKYASMRKTFPKGTIRLVKVKSMPKRSVKGAVYVGNGKYR